MNKVTIYHKYSLPRIDDLLDQLQRATVFSKINLRLGYLQLKIREEDIPKTAFQTNYEHYEFLIMSFYSTNALATCMSLVIGVFNSFLDSFIIVFRDEMLVDSESKEGHETCLHIVLGA